MKPLRGSNSSNRYVHTISPHRCDITLADWKDNFDIREFLCGGLGKIPPRPKPAILTLEDERIIKAVRCSLHVLLTSVLGLNFRLNYSQKDKVCVMLPKW